MAPVGWALLSSGILVLWCGMTCRNPVTAIKDALSDTPVAQRQSGCGGSINRQILDGLAPNAQTNPVGPTGDIGRSSPVTAGAGSVMAAGVLRDAGFRGVALIVSTAIGGAETGWNPGAVGDTTITDATWGPSVGFMQIRSKKAETGTGGWRDATRLADPAFNARAAFAISAGGNNFDPWTTYKNGAYRRFLNEAKDAAAQVGG